MNLDAQHIMIDIETLGTGSRSAILQIGAVVFQPRSPRVEESFSVNVNLVSCVLAGLEIDASTAEWWRHQSDVAKLSLLDPAAVPLQAALAQLSTFVGVGRPIWARGPHFDIVILENAYRAVDAKVPWRYSAVRDSRTVLDVAQIVAPIRDAEFEPAHVALGDARYEARCVSYALLNLTRDR